VLQQKSIHRLVEGRRIVAAEERDRPVGRLRDDHAHRRSRSQINRIHPHGDVALAQTLHGQCQHVIARRGFRPNVKVGPDHGGILGPHLKGAFQRAQPIGHGLRPAQAGDGNDLRVRDVQQRHILLQVELQVEILLGISRRERFELQRDLAGAQHDLEGGVFSPCGVQHEIRIRLCRGNSGGQHFHRTAHHPPGQRCALRPHCLTANSRPQQNDQRNSDNPAGHQALPPPGTDRHQNTEEKRRNQDNRRYDQQDVDPRRLSDPGWL